LIKKGIASNPHTEKPMERFDFGLLAILLAGIVGATQARVLLSSAPAEVRIASEEPELDPGLDKLPAIPRAGVPIIVLEAKDGPPAPEPLGWDDEPAYTSIQHRVMTRPLEDLAVEEQGD
jgi:hypothetical protein